MNKPALYFLRHGIAVDKGTPKFKDSERPLIPKGIKEVKKVAKALKRMKFKPDLILTSPYIRAAHTAEIAAKILKIKNRFRYSLNLTPSKNFQTLLKELQKLSRKNREILLVGHEPHLSGFISLLISGDSKTRLILKKSGLCKVIYEPQKLLPGRCALAWLLTPSQIISL